MSDEQNAHILTEYESFGQFIHQKRLDKSIALRQMAELIGISPPYLVDIEKGNRYPPEMEKLRQIGQILTLSSEEFDLMLDLAGKKRGSVAPDIPDYIIDHNYVSVALRTARDLDVSEADWMKFVEELKKRKG